MSARSGCASSRRSACAAGARRQERQRARCTPSPQAMCPQAVHQRGRADELDRRADRRSPSSEKRSATGCTGVAVAIAACSRLAWNGSRPCPSPVVPSGKIATTSPARQRLGHLRGRRAARRACVRARGRACRPRRPAGRAAASALTSALETKRACGHDRVDRHDVEPRDVVGGEQRCRRGRRCPRRASAMPSTRSILLRPPADPRLPLAPRRARESANRTMARPCSPWTHARGARRATARAGGAAHATAPAV